MSTFRQQIEKTEFEQMRDKALDQLMKGQSLAGKNGVFAGYFNNFCLTFDDGIDRIPKCCPESLPLV